MLPSSSSGSPVPKPRRISPRAWQRILTIALTFGLLASLPGMSLANDIPMALSETGAPSSPAAARSNNGSNPTVPGRGQEDTGSS
ncbi:MAG TPA: hypothetical protein VKT80_11515, partial [Chloroflexota bacterium]|nr:hypothetical protein [Chloroflexota bacterium]